MQDNENNKLYPIECHLKSVIYRVLLYNDKNKHWEERGGVAYVWPLYVIYKLRTAYG